MGGGIEVEVGGGLGAAEDQRTDHEEGSDSSGGRRSYVYGLWATCYGLPARAVAGTRVTVRIRVRFCLGVGVGLGLGQCDMSVTGIEPGLS